MPTILSSSSRQTRRLLPGPPKDREAGDPSLSLEHNIPASVQPGRGPDLREPRVQPGRGPDLREKLEPQDALPRFLPGTPKDRAESAVALREERRKARLLAAQAAAEASDNMAKAQAEAERGAPGFTEARLAELNLREREVMQAVRPELHETVARDFAELKAETAAEAEEYELRRRVEAIREDFDDALASHHKSIARKPASFGLAMRNMEEMVRESELRPDLIESELVRVRRRLFESYRQARLAGPKPEAFLRELEAGRFDALVPPEEREALVAQTAAEVGQRQRAALMERQVEADTRQRLELQRLQAGEGGDPHITPEELREIFPGEVGEGKARRLEDEMAVAETFNELANAPAETRNKALEAVGGPPGVAKVAADEAPAAEDSTESTANREGASAGPRNELGEAASEDEPARAPGLESDADVDPDALAQLTQEERDQVIGRERGSDFQGERPQDPVRGVAAAPDSEAANAVRRAVAKIERSLENDSKQHVWEHDNDIREADAKAEAARAYANRPDLSPEERRQARQAAALATQHSVGLSDARQTEIKSSDIGNRVLTKPDAAAKARELASLDFDGQVAWWRDIDDHYGPFAGRVLNEVVASGLTLGQKGTALLVLYGAEPELLKQWEIAKDLSETELRAALRPDHIYHTNSNITDELNPFATTIDASIRSQVSDILAAFESSGRGKEGRERLQMARKLAFHLELQGVSRKEQEAVVQAFFPFEVANGSVAVPNDVLHNFGVFGGRGAIERALDRKLRETTEDVIGFSFAGVRNDLDLILNRSQMEQLYADHVRGHGRWRNTCNGVQLVDGGGRPVRHKDGSFVAFTWEEIEEIARADQHAQQREAEQERAVNDVPSAVGFRPALDGP